MKLSKRTAARIAEMICGRSGMDGQYAWPAFPYRSSQRLTQFFDDIDLDYTHTSGTRFYWVQEVLEELNGGEASDTRLPSDAMIEVIRHLLDPIHFQPSACDFAKAVDDLNKILRRDNLGVASAENELHIHHIPTGARATKSRPQTRPLNPTEQRRHSVLLAYLEVASEDDFTEFVVVPLFQHLGFSRVTMKGHRDKSLEYGKDLWMKFVIPSDHVLYFGAQVKIGTIRASASLPSQNIASILAQLQMVFGHPIFDPANNSKHLVDHAYLISSGEITEQARQLISDELSNSMKRQILFMDQADILRMWALTSLELPNDEESVTEPANDDIPF